jgi:hypothetical protein
MAAYVAAALVLLSGCSLAPNGTTAEETLPSTGGETEYVYDEYQYAKSDERTTKFQDVADAIGVDTFWIPNRPYVPVEIEAVTAVGTHCVVAIATDPRGGYDIQLLSRYDESANILTYVTDTQLLVQLMAEFEPECLGERPFDPANHGLVPEVDPTQEA